MGVHHYQLELVPRIATEADLESDELWAEQPSETLLNGLRALLPQNKSWGPCEEYESAADWGSDLRIWHVDENGGPVRSIVFRFAPVADEPDLLKRFLALVAEHGFVVHSRAAKRTLEPNIADVLGDLKLTSAFRFITDPAAAIVEAADVKPPRQR